MWLISFKFHLLILCAKALDMFTSILRWIARALIELSILITRSIVKDVIIRKLEEYVEEVEKENGLRRQAAGPGEGPLKTIERLQGGNL